MRKFWCLMMLLERMCMKVKLGREIMFFCLRYDDIWSIGGKKDVLIVW